MERIQELEKKRNAIEQELEDQITFLTSEGMPGLHGSLTDDEGFPLSDIDVYSVRTARYRVACLKTDYKEVNQALDKSLQELHSQSKISVARPDSHHNNKYNNNQPQVEKDLVNVKAFAIIDEVQENSPAEEAGLQVGDALVSFGDVSLNKNCASVSECFKRLKSMIKEGESLDVSVVRGSKICNFLLVPKLWRGTGLIGCHLQPIS